ncbi:MAG TPA: glycogen debranching enzyme N-terminal domain-containing protein, partial [Nitrospiria bacterium]|nr:glycogen debranching enzyme N-terminal domain-containing protein [Nitrospiria bacterium]
MQIELGPDILQDYEKASKREWLVTNGIGGYSSSSLAGSNTRKYHGLLVAALSPPTGRVVTLSKLEETFLVNGQAFPLSANQYPGALSPQGFRFLSLFKRYPVPTFLYRPTQDIEIEKSIWMAPGKNTTYIRYTLLRSPTEARIRLLPLMAWMDYHAEFHRREDFPFSVSWQDPELRVTPYAGVAPLRLRFEHARFFSMPDWYYNLEHLRELERGLDFSGDLYSPGYFERDLSPGDSIIFAATVESSIENGEAVLASVVEQQQRLITRAGVSDDFGKMMVLAADQFIIHPPRGSNIRATVIAGYPWFTDWGRDTMISLPGLCLSTGRPETAREILAAFAGFISKGMLPNRFPDAGQDPEYNTVDAALWYFQAVYNYLNKTDDADFIGNYLLPGL